MPSNAEWEVAAAVNAAAADANCNNGTSIVAATGASATCVSEVGAYDTTENLDEWVADWVPLSNGAACTTWSGIGSNDLMCLVGVATFVAHEAPRAPIPTRAVVPGVRALPWRSVLDALVVPSRRRRTH